MRGSVPPGRGGQGKPHTCHQCWTDRWSRAGPDRSRPEGPVAFVCLFFVWVIFVTVAVAHLPFTTLCKVHGRGSQGDTRASGTRSFAQRRRQEVTWPARRPLGRAAVRGGHLSEMRSLPPRTPWSAVSWACSTRPPALHSLEAGGSLFLAPMCPYRPRGRWPQGHGLWENSDLRPCLVRKATSSHQVQVISPARAPVEAALPTACCPRPGAGPRGSPLQLEPLLVTRSTLSHHPSCAHAPCSRCPPSVPTAFWRVLHDPNTLQLHPGAGGTPGGTEWGELWLPCL